MHEARSSAILPDDVRVALQRAPDEAIPFRVRSLAETVAAALPLAATAGLTRVADLRGLDSIDLPVVTAIRPNAKSMCVSSGKGWSREAAWVSGIMEALELYHAERFDEGMRFGDLDGGIVVPDPGSLPLARDRTSDPVLSPALRMAGGMDVVSDAPAAVPLDLVHVVLRPDWPATCSGFLISTNGLTSGNSRDEALLHGICEVVERDALALLHARDPGHALTSLPTLNWDTVDDTPCRNLVDQCRRVGIDVLAFDITSDLGIPTYYCRLAEHSQQAMSAAIGTGCHPSPTLALRRAVAEAAQTRVLLISGARDDLRMHSYAPVGLTRAADRRSVPFDTRCGFGETRIEGAIDWLVAQIAAAGFDQIIAVDLASLSDALVFLRVVIPGLEGSIHSSQYCPGKRARQVARLP